MSVTTTAPAATTTTTAPATSLIGGGLTATAIAAAATTTVAAAGEFAGMGAVVGGAPIPAFGFTVLTVVFSVVGLVLALVLSRFARHPRTAWIRTTVVLAVLSVVPDLLADAAVGTKVLLIATHVVAAVIVIPAVARRLS